MKGKNKDNCVGNQSLYGSATTAFSSPSSNGGATSASTSNGVLNQAAPLSFPDITPVEHEKLCPRFTSILNRADGVGVGIEEMDSLQMEIESLLVNVMQRNRLLKVESMILDSDKNETLLVNGGVLNKSMGSQAMTPNEKHLNKLKRSIAAAAAASSGKPNNIPASFLKTNSLLSAEITQPIVRNDIPDIFWQSVDPYCADVTEDDIKLLENQMEQCDKYLQFNKIGPLGKHYSVQWSEEDLGHQIKEGSRFIDLDSKTAPRKRKLNEQQSSAKKLANSLIDQSFDKLNKQSHQNTNTCSTSSSHSYGPLTQRLISALIEQNLMTPFDNEIADYLDKISPPESTYLSPRTMAKKFSFNSPATLPTITNTSTAHNNHHNHNHHTNNHHQNNNNHTSHIERKIKKTLIEQGILDLDLESEDSKHGVMDAMGSSSGDENGCGGGGNVNGNGGCDNQRISKDDEIAMEILNVQNELKMVSRQCKQTLGNLVELSKQNIVKQEIKKKINATDTEIIEIFEKFQNARLNKKPLTKKEKEKAQKLIKEREALKNQLKTVK